MGPGVSRKRSCVTVRHSGQVRLRKRAGIQEKFDYIGFSLDSGPRPPEANLAGMTALSNSDTAWEGGFRRTKQSTQSKSRESSSGQASSG